MFIYISMILIRYLLLGFYNDYHVIQHARRDKPMTIPRERILLVDDEEAIRFVLNKGLSMRGYTCEEAGDSEEALSKLETKPPELVMLDINMPGKQGNEVLPDIKERFPDTAVIMASGVSDERVIAKCIKDGAQDYITKPFNFEQVLKSVGRALDKRKLEIQIRSHLQKSSQTTDGKTTEVRKIFLDAIEILVRTLEESDKYTAGHSREVTKIALSIGQQLGLSSHELEDLRWAALLHDVGKIAVDPDILNKPGELTPSEYRHIMTHAVAGPSLVKPFVNDRVVEIISHHHDHFDGSGLDQLIAGEAIPLGARIVAVADAYQAMISDRPYRRALPKLEALEELSWNSGSQFDPLVANTLIKIINDQEIQHSLRMDEPGN
jgi:putative nucleotidyltransferase with HDIG domain